MASFVFELFPVGRQRTERGPQGPQVGTLLLSLVIRVKGSVFALH